jgi:hypothetical protein
MGFTNPTATKEELSRLFQRAGLAHYVIAPLEKTSVIHLDDRKLHEYSLTYYSIKFFGTRARGTEVFVEKRSYLWLARVRRDRDCLRNVVLR